MSEQDEHDDGSLSRDGVDADAAPTNEVELGLPELLGPLVAAERARPAVDAATVARVRAGATARWVDARFFAWSWRARGVWLGIGGALGLAIGVGLGIVLGAVNGAPRDAATASTPTTEPTSGATHDARRDVPATSAGPTRNLVPLDARVGLETRERIEDTFEGQATGVAPAPLGAGASRGVREATTREATTREPTTREAPHARRDPSPIEGQGEDDVGEGDPVGEPRDPGDARSALVDERVLLDRARTLVRERRADAALAVLATYGDRHRDGALREEAIALEVRAQLARGATELAERAFARLLADYPTSLHRGSLRSALDAARASSNEGSR